MTLPSWMTAIEISTPGGPEVLRPAQLPLPLLRPGEMLIRVAAAGVNAPDAAQRRGAYDPPADASPLPGLEVAGTVAALGDATTGFAEGDAVVALCNGGGYAEFVAVPARQILPLPPGWDMAAGAALPETFFTVQQSLVMRAGVDAGMTVLVHGAAGGIGGAAVQIARRFGATVIAVVSSPEKGRYAQQLGAAAVIDHTAEDFVTRTLELTGGRGADRIVDVVGGDYLPRNIAAAARGGHIVQISAIAGTPSPVSALRIVRNWLTISGSTLRPQPAEAKAAIAASLLETVWPALADGRIVPPRLGLVPLAEAAAAHVRLERREHYGKLVLLTDYGRSLGAGTTSADN